MEPIMNLMTENFGAMGPMILVGGLGLALIIGTLPFILKQRKDPLEKLRETEASSRKTANSGQALRASKGNDTASPLMSESSGIPKVFDF